jgi:precorrin-3B synthase
MSGRGDLVEGRCPGALRPMPSGDGLILRVRPRLSKLSLAQLHMLGDAAARFGDGILYLSNRANVQIRGLTEAGHSAALDLLAAHTLIDGDPRVEAIRNIMVTPGIALHRPDAVPEAPEACRILQVQGNARPSDPVLLPKGRRDAMAPSSLGERVGVRGDFQPVSMHHDVGSGISSKAANAMTRGQKIAAAVEDVLATTEALHRLPGKFGMGIQSAHDVDLATMSDVTFLVCADGIAMVLEGAFDRAILFEETGEAVAGFVRVALAFLRLHGKYPSLRRMRDSTAQLGLEAVLKEANLSSAPIALRFQDRPPVGDLGEAFGIAFAFGEITQEALGQIVGFMKREGVAEAGISPHRALVFPRRGQDETIFHQLARGIGGIIDPGDIRLRVHRCPGAPACSRATVATRRDAEAVLAALRDTGVPLSTIHISGCEKKCAYPRGADITAIGADGLYDVEGPRSQSRKGVMGTGLAAVIADMAEAL